MKNRKILTLASFALLSLALTGCEGVRRELGLTPTAPDEFAVVTKAPLVLPPDFSLRPPQPGVRRPQDVAPRQSARSALTGQQGGVTVGQIGTPGEQALLGLAGARNADSGIRRQIDQETAQLEIDSKSFTERLLFWRQPAAFGTVVDPVKEAQRIRENAAQGKPITEGETPTIKRRKRAPLEGLFN